MTKYLDAIDAANPDGLWKNESGTALRRLAFARGQDRLRAHRHRLLGLRRDADARRWRSPPAAPQDAEKYAQLFEKIRAAFQKQFVHADGFVAGADNSPSQFGEINNPECQERRAATRRPATCWRCT